MTPIVWLACFIAAGIVSDLISPWLTAWVSALFPLSRRADESRIRLFSRVVLSASMFGAIVGLVGGFSILTVKLLANL